MRTITIELTAEQMAELEPILETLREFARKFDMTADFGQVFWYENRTRAELIVSVLTPEAARRVQDIIRPDNLVPLKAKHSKAKHVQAT